MEVRFGQIFLKHFNNFPKADQIKIRAFAKHIEQFGFDGLQGRNKSSDDAPMTHPNWSERIIYAKTHNLWHYHIGIPHYEKSKKAITHQNMCCIISKAMILLNSWICRHTHL